MAGLRASANVFCVGYEESVKSLNFCSLFLFVCFCFAVVGPFSLSVQAQAVLNDSSQKLDLLKYSLEQRLSELPKNHPKISEVKEELAMAVSPPLSPRQSIISTHTQYSTVAKPAALTGTPGPSGLTAGMHTHARPVTHPKLASLTCEAVYTHTHF